MKRTLAVLALAAAGILALAAPAGAAGAPSCPKASVTFTQTGVAAFAAATSQPGCTVRLSSWAVPATYDGRGYDASAKPQALYDRATVTLGATPAAVQVRVPPSRWCQIDFRAANGTYLYGRIVECHPPAVVTPKPPIVCKAHQHLSHGKCTADRTTPAPTPSRTPAARVRITHAQLAATGGFDHPVLWTGVLMLVGGIVLRAIRAADRRH